MTEATDIGPLDWRIGIVDKTGRPTPEFQRRWNAQRNNNNLIGSVTLGNGKPPAKPVPTDGAEYIDISTSPFTLYVGSAGIWTQVGVVNFTDLSDAPHSYAGNADKLIQVKPTEDGLQFIPIASVQSVGCSFYAGGLLKAGEELGSGVFSKIVNFDNSLPYSITSLFPATSTAVLNLKMLVTGAFVTVATITFSAGSSIGVLAWLSATTVPIGTPIALFAPLIADATLSAISGLIQGTLP